MSMMMSNEERAREAFRKAYYERLNRKQENGVPLYVEKTLNWFLVKQRRDFILPLGMPIMNIQFGEGKSRRLDMIGG